jgi:hypothetical protein
MKALNHSEAQQLIEQAADGPLTASEQRALESHLQGCADCRAYAAEFAAVEAALGATMLERWGKPQLSPSAEKNMVQVILHELGYNQVGEAQEETPYDHETGTPSPVGALRSFLILLGAGIVALILLGILWFVSNGGLIPGASTPTVTETATPSSTLTTTATPTASQTSTASDTPTPTVLILTAIPQQNVNCRLGNSSMFDIADTLFLNEVYTPIARGIDNLWVQFRGPVTNVKCWVFVENINLLINDVITPIDEIPESLLPFVNYPPTPTPTFTASPEPQEPSDTPLSSLPHCNDGFDNDQDGAIDMRDKDCETPSDNNEFD